MIIHKRSASQTVALLYRSSQIFPDWDNGWKIDWVSTSHQGELLTIPDLRIPVSLGSAMQGHVYWETDRNLPFPAIFRFVIH